MATTTGHCALDLKCYAGRLPPTALISLADTRGGEGKLRLDRYLRTTNTDGWFAVNIPLVAFAGSVDLEHLKALALGFQNSAVLNRGRVYVDNIRLEAGTPSRLLVDDFEVNIQRGDHARAVGIHEFENLLNQRTYEFANGAAAIRMDIDQNRQMDDGGRSLILSYGGSIGLDLKEAGFSFSGWHTGLAGINVSPYTLMKLRVRGKRVAKLHGYI